ncbi:MAG TPA: Y-family DNA polymerase [Prolixibacteraceae bacterium]|nr:Y-family DNA polymerase [Prolixibacteraceae bacterium]HPS12304.1 Y-family DNA polymerase [Prolixibacteraceae bacterium]
MIALVDCNNFYVSCERVFRPDLNGKPVVVLSNNDGCIISRSNEAKQLGIKMAEPAHKIEKFMHDNQVTCFSSNYALYGDMSQRVMDTLREAVPEVEVYSIDEAFLNMDGILNLQEFATELKNKVFRNTGIPVSIGIGFTKTIAKVANKRSKQHNGVLVIDNELQLQEILEDTPIDKVWGVGRNYQKLLLRHQVETAREFTQLNPLWVKKNMSVAGHRIQKELLGEPCIEMEQIPQAKKVIATTRSFGKKLSEKEPMREAISTHAIRCAEKLRRQHCAANLLTVFIHTDPFNPNEKMYYKSQTIILPVATSNSSLLVKASAKALDAIFRSGLLFKKAGVIVSGIVPDNQIQGNLFFEEDRQRQDKISVVTDRINRKYGRDTLKLAAQGSGKEWKLKQEKLSKCYTTKLDEIIQVKA